MRNPKIKYSKLLGTQSKKSKVAKNIAVIATTLSVTIVIVATIVADGFRQEIENSTVELIDYAHIKDMSQVFAGGTDILLTDNQLEEINSIISPQELIPTLETQAVIQNKINIIPSALIAQNNSTIKPGEIILSKSAAQKLDVEIGDKVEIYSLEEDEPTTKSFKVTDLYTTNIVDMEALIAKISVEDLRTISYIDSQSYSYYAVPKTTELMPLADYASYEGLDVETAEMRAPHIYGWLLMIDNNMSLVLIIMIVVAIINIITSTLIVMLDSTKTVATLRALGMNRWAVSKIFVVGIGKYAFRGMACGVLIGSVIGVVQGGFNIIELDAAAYFVDTIPIAFNAIKLIGYMALMGAAVVISLLVPINIVTRLNIASALKYQ